MNPTSDNEVLSDRDPNNGGGRTSRGSNRSGLSRSPGKKAPATSAKTAPAASEKTAPVASEKTAPAASKKTAPAASEKTAPSASGKIASPASSSNLPALFGHGITSMLRTETELGDLGDIVFGNLSGSSSRQHRTQWHGAYNMSASSSKSISSSRASRPFPGYSSSSSVPRYLTVPNGRQYGAINNPPAMPNLHSSSPPEMIENRDPNRSQSTTRTVQSPYSVSADRSHTSLRQAHNLRHHNSYTHLASHRGGPGSSTLNNWPTSSALNDNIGLPSQASHNAEGQRPSTGSYSHTYANTGHPQNSRGQSNVGRGQSNRILGQAHNLGQIRVRLPYQPSSRSLEGRHGEMEAFPPFDGTAYDERLDSLHAGKLQSHRHRSESRHADHLSEPFALPANHKQYVAVEQADSKRSVTGPASSNSTYLRTNSDALSCDTTASLVSNDGRSIEVLRRPVDMKKTESKDIGFEPSNLCFSVAGSMPAATRGESKEEMTNKAASNPNSAAGPRKSKEDSVPGVPAEFVRGGSDVPIDELCGNGTPSERHGDVLEYAVASTRTGMRPSPVITQVMSDHAQESWDERSFKSCTSLPDESPGPAGPEPGKSSEEYPASTPNVLPRQGEHLMDPDTYSCPTVKGATDPDSVGLQPSTQAHLSRPATMGVRNTRINLGVHPPRSAVARKPLPVYSTQDHFPCLSQDSRATRAGNSSEGSLRNSQANTRLGQDGRTASDVGIGPRHASRRSATGIGSHRNSLSPTRLTDIQEDSIQEDGAADLELSRHRYPGQLHCLSDLKEESHDGSNAQSMFGAPPGMQTLGKDLDNVSKSSTVSHRRSDTDSNANDAFTQSRGLTPMQPGQVDLSDELSGNVGLRQSRSVEQVPYVSQKLNRGSLSRPAAAGEVQRQRISLAEVEEVERAALSMQPVATLGLSEMHRACSPGLVTDIEGLTLPSVGGLTQSPSASSSSLKETCKRCESTESLFKERVDRTHPAQKRSSARLGSVPGIPRMAPDEAAHDELERRGQKNSKEKESDMSGCIDSGVAAIGASGADAVEKLETGNGTTPIQTPHSTAPPTNPQVESSAVTRQRSNALHTQDPRYSSVLTLPSSRSFQTQRNAAPPPNSQVAPPAASCGRSSTIHNQDPRCSSDFKLSPRRSSRSRASTSQGGETHPLNPDTNCASAVSTNTAADTILPHSAAAGHPPHSRPPHIRNRLSEASSTTAFSTAQTVAASPPADSTARAPTDHLNSFSYTNNQPHEAGERYPTSALSPPTAIFRDQLCVSDTDDDDVRDITREARDPLCKRILTACDNTYYKLALRASRAQPSPEWFGPSATQVVQDSAREAQDLTASAEAESHKQGHPKTWWQKSSHRIRLLTVRKPSSKNNG